MKKLLTTTLAAIVCVGCQSTDSAKVQPVQPAESVEVSGGSQTGSLIEGSSNRNRIRKMLNTVQLKRFPISDAKSMTLQDIVDELYKALKHNETKISFIIDTQLLFSDVEQDVKISINPPLRSVTLGQVLEKIVQTATVPMKYTVEEFGIIFSPKLGEAPKLITRLYRVDSKRLLEALNKHSDIKFHDFFQPGYTTALQKYIEASGVDFRHHQPPQWGIHVVNQNSKVLFFHHQKSLLYLRATQAEIDIVEDVVTNLNSTTTPQY